MDKVLVDRELLEQIVNTNMGDYALIALQHKEILAILAQPADAEVVQRYCFDQTGCDVADNEGPWVSYDDHIAALSAVTAERDRLQTALSAPDTITAEPAGDYDNLRKQFLSLRMLANSNAKMAHYWCAQCDRETRETLLANAASVNAERDTNSMLTDALETAERERDQLRAEVERYVPLHEAVQRAAGELPEGWAIQLYIERDGGGVELIGSDGTVDFATNNERLDYTVIDALEAAMAAKEA